MSGLGEHADELAEELDASREEIYRSLENLVKYAVPIEEAKQSVRRKYE